MMLYIRRNVFVMGMAWLQGRVVRVRLRIVPVQLLLATEDLIPVGVDHDRQSVIKQPLADNQINIPIKVQFSSNPGECGAAADESHCRVADGGKCFLKRIQKEFVIVRSTQRIYHPTWMSPARLDALRCNR